MTPPINIDGTDITGASIDGQDVSAITVDGTQVFSTIPGSVLNQWDAIVNFSQGDSTIEDSVGSSNMSLTGDYQNATIGGESGAEGDGSDDSGLASLTETIADQSSFAIATSFKGTGSGRILGHGDVGGKQLLTIGYNGGGNSDSGNLAVHLQDDSDSSAIVKTDNLSLADGNTHWLIWNKPDDNPSNWNVYVDNPGSTVSTTVSNDQGYDSSNHTPFDMAFWAVNFEGSISSHTNITIGVYELNRNTYNQSEREDFISRRPELS